MRFHSEGGAHTFVFSIHRMRTRVIIFILSKLFISSTHAQQSIINARDLALSYSTVASVNTFTVQENIASIRNNGTLITLTGLNRFIKEFSSIYGSATHASQNGFTFYAGIGRMGRTVYAEQFCEAGIARRLGKSISAGIKLRYYQWIIGESGYPNSSSIMPDLNLAFHPTGHFAIGVIIRNPVRSRMSAVASERLPSSISTGFTYTLSKKVTLSMAGRQRDRILSIQSGVEYQPQDWVFLRAGMQSSPVCQSYGFGLKHKNLLLDAGMQIGTQAGNSSAISLTFLL